MKYTREEEEYTDMFREIQWRPTLVTVPEETPEELAAEELEVSVSTKQPEVVTAPEEPKPVSPPETPQVPVALEQPQVHRKCKQKLKHLNYPKNKEPEEALPEREEPFRQILQREPVTAPQQAPNTTGQTPAEAFYLQTGVKMIQVSEVFMSDKDELTVQLEQEEAVLRVLVKSLKERIQITKAQASEADTAGNTRSSRLSEDLKEVELKQKEVPDRVSKLEKELEEEKKLQKEAEASLVQQKEENSRLVSALAQAQEDLRREKLRWQEERAGLQQSIKDQQEALEHLDTAKEDMKRRMELLAEQVEEMKKKKKPKKRPLWKRIFCIS